ncbi:MAG: alpha-L-fucosidase [Candidatus Zhuqueibacterota bacterium]
MKSKLMTWFVFIGILILPLRVAAQENTIYQATWESLKSRPYPQWFSDAKLGIFIHWGVYSVPAWSGREQYAEWFLRGLESGDSARIQFQKRAFGENFTYRDYAPLFKAELFEANEWAQLFARSGARYVILVSKHHDGYCLWPSRYAPGWNSSDVGPRRDIVGELSAAVRNAGLKMGLYYSLPEWNNRLFRWYTDPNDQIGPYVEQHMIPQFRELISAYRPEVLFTDGEWFHSAETWHAPELIAWYYNLVGPDAIVNNRWGAGSDIGFLTPEYSAGIHITDRPWAECRGLGRSFGLNRNEKLDAYLSASELIHFFVKAVAHGGGMTLNVGPGADGQIPLLQQERLVQLGRWLQVNGEAIYGSKPWAKTGETKSYFLERIDSAIDFDWVRNSPGTPIAEDDFSVTWTGFIQPEFSEEYRFTIHADDSAEVWIDGRAIPDAEFAGTSQERSGRMHVTAFKKYPIKIRFIERKQNASIQLYWESPRQPGEIVPGAHLFTSNQSAGSGDGLNGRYESEGHYLCYTTHHGNLYAICLEWPGKELVLPVGRPQRDARVALVGLHRDLSWQYKNNRLRIDTSQISCNELPCEHAWVFRISGNIHQLNEGRSNER